MSAPHFKIDNLTAIIDCNGYQLSGSTEDVMSLGNMAEKLKAFGWDAVDVDGNDVEALCKALDKDVKRDRPVALIMHTVKGKGLSFAENDNSWHHTVVTQKAYEEGLSELGFEIQ